MPWHNGQSKSETEAAASRTTSLAFVNPISLLVFYVL